MEVEASLVEDSPVAERRQQRLLRKLDNTVLIDLGKKIARVQDAELRMTHSRQRLCTGKAFALEIDLGLIPNLKPIVAERFSYRDARARCGVRGIGLRSLLVVSEVRHWSRPVAEILRVGIVHARRPACDTIA